MQNWIACGESFIPGDVVRWKEPVWPQKKSRSKRKIQKLGDRLVTAAVLTTDNKGYVRLSVLKDEIVDNKFGMPLKALPKGELLTKKRSTIGKGSAERLKWSDESARDMAISTFVGSF